MVMQDDGELAMFNSRSDKMWSTNSSAMQQILNQKNQGKAHILGWECKKELQQDQSLTSPNGHHKATMQSDGNFVVYTHGQAKWASNTNNKGTGPYRLAMQEDGNLVVYDRNNSATWATGTNGKGHGAHMVMQDDGELAMFNSRSEKMWSSRGGSESRESQESKNKPHILGAGCKKELQQDQSLTSPNGQHKATMQSDGNFVVYTNGQAKWASNTNNKGSGPYRLAMQDDGNLVVYDRNNSATWASGTNGRGDGAHMVMQDDGELVMFDSASRRMWSMKK